jgi:Glycosyl transferases group 1
MRDSRIRILALFAQYTRKLGYFDDWLDALRRYPRFDLIPVNIVAHAARRRIKRALNEVDAVVLLHSTNADTVAYINPHSGLLAQRRVPLLTFVGNEVNLPGTSIAAKRRLFEVIQPEWIASQLVQEAGEYLFGDLASRGVISVPHALNADVFQPRLGHEQRPIDIGSRVAKYVPHLGDDDRNRIVETFLTIGRARGLSVDISHEPFDRQGWASFLNQCKGTVSTESGSWFLERDDSTVEAIRRYIRERESGILVGNDSKLLMLAGKLPGWARPASKWFTRKLGFRSEIAISEAFSYADIHARFFAEKPRPPVYGKAISSRHFEAIGTKTCQIMLRGRFNDILHADRHYLALDADFANLDDVVARFLDPEQRRIIVDEAFTYLMDKHTYAHRMRRLYDVLIGTSHVHRERIVRHT